MASTNGTDMLIRSVEHSDGTEYDFDQLSASREGYIPDHYVRRLWRRPTPIAGGGAISLEFINKDAGRSVLYSTVEQSDTLIVKNGSHNAAGTEIAKIVWTSGKGKDKSNMTMGNKSGSIKDILKKASLLSQSRVFVGPDGIEYKWKTMSFGNDPAFPEAIFRTLYAKDSEHPVATTQRLVERDGNSKDVAYPLYLAPRGLQMQDIIVATLVILERIV